MRQIYLVGKDISTERIFLSGIFLILFTFNLLNYNIQLNNSIYFYQQDINNIVIFFCFDME